MDRYPCNDTAQQSKWSKVVVFWWLIVDAGCRRQGGCHSKNCVGLRHSFSSRASFLLISRRVSRPSPSASRSILVVICQGMKALYYFLMREHIRTPYLTRNATKENSPCSYPSGHQRHPIRLRLFISPSGPYLMIYKIYFRRDVPVNRPPKTGCR